MDGWAPRLSAAVAALESRRRALEQGDERLLLALGGPDAGSDPVLQRYLSLQAHSYRARAWYLRLDRDSADVTEDYRLVGNTPDRPVDEEGTKKLQMIRRGAEFFFSQGLM